ncbi:MAG TPA: NADH-quinone oxidoreductase subunit C [Terracidiphilus sp.]|jgi:NADH-quinone oxidoreductase subunit C|nr:NADH-quinone oxidoreductase subunit C [Terracidiphilus sp.]
MAESVKSTLANRAEVVEAMPEHPAMKALLAWDDAGLLDARFDREELTLSVAPSDIVPALEALKAAGYNAFEDMTAVDWFPNEPRFQLSYHILSHKFKERVRLRAMVGSDEAAVDSATSVWPGANYYEREVFDLFGIRFEGHPNLRRILMPEDWVGYPLRKDYPVEGYR